MWQNNVYLLDYILFHFSPKKEIQVKKPFMVKVREVKRRNV